MHIDGVDIYGLHAYGSLFGMNVKQSTSPYLVQARRVFAFKKFGRKKEVFSKLIEAMKTACQADLILAIPSSKAGKTSILQEIFGIGLLRVADSEKRKYNHSHPVDDAGKVELLSDVAGTRILLVDDIVTTGKSILFYRQMLLNAGASEVIAAGVGISLAASVDCPDAQVVDEAFKRISDEQAISDEVEPEDEQNETSLESMLSGASEKIKTELADVQWIRVSGEVANKIRKVARQLQVSEAEVVRRAFDEL